MTILAKRAIVILDTNALLLFSQGIDVFAQTQQLLSTPFSFIIPKTVINEIERLSKQTTKDGRAAKLALALIREKERRQQEGPVSRLLLPKTKEIPLKIAPGSGHHHADDAILAIAEDDPAAAVVVTLDKELQHRLLARQVRVLGVKQQRLASIE